TEIYAAREACGLHEAPQLVVVPALTDPLLCDESGGVLALRLALLAGEHLLRSEQPDGLPVDRLAEGDGPEDVLPLLLAPGTKLGRERLELLAVVGEVEVEHHVAVDDLAAVDGEAGLEGLGLEERV